MTTKVGRDAIDVCYQSLDSALHDVGFTIERYLSTMEELVEAGYVRKNAEDLTITYVLTELGSDLLRELPEEWDRKVDEAISEALQLETDRVVALHVLSECGGITIIKVEGEKMRIQTAKLKREDGRVWLEGVPPTKLLDNMFHLDGFPAAMRSVLKYKGVEDKYLDDDIFAAITGQPFRFWFSPDWASCLGYTHEEPLGIVVAKVLGYEYNWHAGLDGMDIDDLVGHKRTLNGDAVAMAWQELVGEIEAGNPVILFGGDAVVDPKAGPVIVTGYNARCGLIYFVPVADWRPAPKWDDANPDCMEGIVELGYRGRKRPDETNWIGNGFAPGQGMGGAKISFFAFRGRGRRPTEHEVAVSVIKRAVDFARGRLIDDLRRSRRPGLEAFGLLARCLDQDGEQFEHAGRRRPWAEIGKEDWWYAMECLGGPTFRKAAATFLRRCALGFGGFSGEQREAIEAAAKGYDGSNANMMAFWNLFASVGPIEEYEDRVRTTGQALSSREIRKKAANIIREIRLNEEHAISCLEKALALENVHTSHHLT